ncbi:CHAT domain-containing protein, partial [Lasiosphaeria miniovina]
PKKHEVLGHLEGCKVFHFAGHGLVNPVDPTQSGLLLDDENITVEDFLDINIKSGAPFLCVLSACLTGASDESLLEDEGLNLISSCQFVGFRRTIGTLWQVSDSVCVEVAEGFYAELGQGGMTGNAVCRGLHRTLVSLRNEWV